MFAKFLVKHSLQREEAAPQFGLDSATFMIIICFIVTIFMRMRYLEKLAPKPRRSTERAFVEGPRRANTPTLSRTKSLIDAALRVWELKQRPR